MCSQSRGEERKSGQQCWPFRMLKVLELVSFFFPFSRLLLDQLKQFSRWTTDLEKLPEMTTGPKFAPC